MLQRSSLNARVQLQQPGNQPEGMGGVGEQRCRLSFSFLGLHVYFKLQVFFYTLTNTLGQKFDIFSFPTQIYCLQKSLLPYRVPASAILSESALLSVIYFLFCVLYLTCDYIISHATFLSLFLIFLNPVCP